MLFICLFDIIDGFWLGDEEGVWGEELGVGYGIFISGFFGFGGLFGFSGFFGECFGLLIGLLVVNFDLILILMDVLLSNFGGDFRDID